MVKNRNCIFGTIFVVFAVFIAVFSLGPKFAQAADFEFVVDNNGWTEDASLGDGICLDASGHCTLSAATWELSFASEGVTAKITFDPSLSGQTITYASPIAETRVHLEVVGLGESPTLDCSHLSEMGDEAISIEYNTPLTYGTSISNLTTNGCELSITNNGTVSDLIIIDGDISSSNDIDQATITGNTLNNGKIRLEEAENGGAANSVIIDNTIYFGPFTGTTAITGGIASNNTISGNSITSTRGSEDFGILLTINGDNNLISYNTSSGVGNALNLGSGTYSDLEISNNTIDLAPTNLHGLAIDENGAGGTLTDLNIDSNTISNGQNRGIYINDLPTGSSPVISNNQISANVEEGIYLENVSGRFEILNNNVFSISSGHSVGISIAGGDIEDGLISNNTVLDNANAGIALYCRSINNGFSDLLVSNITVSNNTLVNNGDGIILFHASSNTVSNNTIVSPPSNPPGTGILLLESEGNHFSQNTIVDGLSVINSDSNDFSQDDLGDSEYGVYLKGSNNNTFSDLTISYVLIGKVIDIEGLVFEEIDDSSFHNYFKNTNFDFNRVEITSGTMDVSFKLRAKVQDQASQPISGATVTFKNKNGNLAGTLTTNQNGYTDYQLLDVYQLTPWGMTNNQNPYTLRAVYQSESKTYAGSKRLTVNSVNQGTVITTSEYIAASSISGFVKKGASGLANIELQLYQDENSNQTLDGDDSLLTIAQTNSTGYYRFSGLTSGDYLVALQTASLPDVSGYQLSGANPLVINLATEQDLENQNFIYSQIATNTNQNQNINSNTNSNLNNNRNYVWVNYNTNTSPGTNQNINQNANQNTNQEVNTNLNQNTNLNTNQPTTLNLENLNLNTNTEEEIPTIEQPKGKDLKLEGKTTPNTRVVITLITENGERIQIETISDENGNWSIILDQTKLPQGEHTIYVQTEINGQLSEMVELAKLVVTGEKKLSTTWLVGIIVLVVLLIVILALVLYYLRRKKGKA